MRRTYIKYKKQNQRLKLIPDKIHPTLKSNYCRMIWFQSQYLYGKFISPQNWWFYRLLDIPVTCFWLFGR